MEGHVALIAELDKDLQKKLTVFEKSIKSEDVKREFESLKQSVASSAAKRTHYQALPGRQEG